jgi:hypothetical protein
MESSKGRQKASTAIMCDSFETKGEDEMPVVAKGEWAAGLRSSFVLKDMVVGNTIVREVSSSIMALSSNLLRASSMQTPMQQPERA